MKILKPYDKIVRLKEGYAIVKSGRDAGKSKFGGQITTKRFYEFDADILICRSNYGDLQKSMFQEIKDVLEEEHLIQFCDFRTRPLKIINRLNGNIIHFEGIGGADLSRTKGFKPAKKLSMILIDEMQQLPDQANLDQALATFRRHLMHEEWKVLMFFNPEPQNSHWCNEYYRMQEDNPNVLALHTSYKDIAGVLTKADLEAIELERLTNNSNYRYLYLGETNGLLGGVYFTFNRAKHLLSQEEVDDLIRKWGIQQILVGIDAATTTDATSAIPVAILNNGQCVTLQYFHHDPKKTHALDNTRLFEKLMIFIEELKTQYDLRMGSKPIHFIIDSANADLIQLMQYRIGHLYRIWSYSMKKIVQMARIMQNAFSKNILLVLDTEGYKDYITNMWRREHPLVTALESVIWLKDHDKFDPQVPNDDTDALTYAISYYFLNPSNIHFPQRQDFYQREVSELNE